MIIIILIITYSPGRTRCQVELPEFHRVRLDRQGSRDGQLKSARPGPGFFAGGPGLSLKPGPCRAGIFFSHEIFTILQKKVYISYSCTIAYC